MPQNDRNKASLAGRWRDQCERERVRWMRWRGEGRGEERGRE